MPYDPIAKASLIEACCHILGNTCRIGRIALSFQWNVTGPGALQAERTFCDQADELHQALAPLAEHIRSLGGVAVLDYSDRKLAAMPPTVSDLPSLSDMCQILSDCHHEACLSIEAAIDVAEDSADRPGIRLLTERLGVHRRHAWRTQVLASGLPGTANQTETKQTVRVSGRSVR